MVLRKDAFKPTWVNYQIKRPELCLTNGRLTLQPSWLGYITDTLLLWKIKLSICESEHDQVF